MGRAHGKARTRMRTRGARLHTAGEYREYSHDTLDTPSAARRDCEYSFTLGSRAACSRRGASYARRVLGVLAVL
jgi:hypothetical protein